MSADIDYLVFTGSHAVGRTVQQLMAGRGKEASVELGGSDAMVVLSSAGDLEAVASYALWSRCVNAGQSCAAVKRLFVHQRHYEFLVSLLDEKIQVLKMGPPTDSTAQMGPMISREQRETVAAQVADAIEQGAKCFQPSSVPETGWFYPPTILTNVPPDARVMTEEVFGPVLPVVPFEDIKLVIEQINVSSFGLTASVFGDPATAGELAEYLQVGTVAINDAAIANYGLPQLSWSGRKNSGPGVSHGLQPLLVMTEPRVITHNLMFHLPLFRKSPWHFGKKGPDRDFAAQVVQAFAPESLWQKMNVGFLYGLFRNRSSRKL